MKKVGVLVVVAAVVAAFLYFDLGARKSKTFTLKLSASYLGDYYLPGAQAEAMYDNNYQARTKGQWVKVVQ